jgi:hypothetical protein
MEFEINFDESFLSMLYRAVIDVDTDYAACVVGEKIVNGASRTADVEHVALGERFVQKVVKNSEHCACLTLAVVRIVNIWTVLGEVVLVPSAQNGGPRHVLLLCSRKE